jgi:hypothetical protein
MTSQMEVPGLLGRELKARIVSMILALTSKSDSILFLLSLMLGGVIQKNLIRAENER